MRINSWIDLMLRYRKGFAIILILIVAAGCAWWLLSHSKANSEKLGTEFLPVKNVRLDGTLFEKTSSGLVSVRGLELWLDAADGKKYECHIGKFNLVCRPL